MRRLCRQDTPNFNARDPATPLSLIVLHYTGMVSGTAALARLCTKGSDVSAHYLIDDDGIIYQMVDEDKRAWHAGKGFWRGLHDINSASIGIEMTNPGHAFGYRPFPAPQIDALKELLASILSRQNIAPQNIWGHADVAPLRKEDPGELFPWQDLARAGFGVWPSRLQPQDDAPATPEEIRTLLRTIGYEAPENEMALKADIIAFQRHFRQQNIAGEADAETCALLRACARRIL